MGSLRFHPRLINWMWANATGGLALLLTTVSMFLFGLIDATASTLAPAAPLRIGELAGIDINDKVLAASLIAVPANFGSTAAGATVQVYINRRVPLGSTGLHLLTGWWRSSKTH
ncbi:MAG: hypothetical protein R2839_07665 [Thermomicrobiales bacterium]